MHQPPFLIALRVLGRMEIGLKPASADQDALRDSVAAREAELPLVELCYLILKHELNGPKRTRYLEQEVRTEPTKAADCT